MAFVISADFTLGSIFRGHDSAGTAEPVPQQPRLFAALVNAACTGSTALPDPKQPGRLVPSPAALEALKWFEENPPTQLSIPQILPFSSTERTVYRDEGFFVSKTLGRKTRGKPLSDGFAYGGTLSWGWDESCVPSHIREALDDLCADVSHLGETDSPVLLRTGHLEDMTHEAVLAPVQSDLRRGDIFQIVAPGRRKVLADWHDKVQPYGEEAYKPEKYSPSVDLPVLPPTAPTGASVQNRIYVPITDEPNDAPWHGALLLPVTLEGTDLNPVRRRKLMVATHQTLARLAGRDESSGLVTGISNAAMGRANGLALHLLDSHEISLVTGNIHGPHLAFLIPRDVRGNDLEFVLKTISRIQRVYTRDAGILTVEKKNAGGTGRQERFLDGAAFWKPAAPGMTRHWVTQAPAVAERRTRNMGSLSDFDVTLLWSLSNVFKGMHPELADSGTPAKRLSTLVGLLAGENETPTVLTHAYPTSRPYDLVHRTNKSMPIRPYTARLRAPKLITDRMVIALGQSRHVGGGLLIPVDTPNLEGGAS